MPWSVSAGRISRGHELMPLTYAARIAGRGAKQRRRRKKGPRSRMWRPDPTRDGPPRTGYPRASVRGGGPMKKPPQPSTAAPHGMSDAYDHAVATQPFGHPSAEPNRDRPTVAGAKR